MSNHPRAVRPGAVAESASGLPWASDGMNKTVLQFIAVRVSEPFRVDSNYV